MRTSAPSVALLLFACVGCAGTQRPQRTAADEEDAAMLARLRTREAEQTRRIAELETRVGLLEAEARNARRAAATASSSGETIRIGDNARKPASASTGEELAASTAPQDVAEEDEPPPKAARGRTPLLRLYGRRSKANTKPLLPVPAVTEKLPVVPLPEQRAAAQLTAASGDAPVASGDPTQAYRAALHSLRLRHFDEAVRAFTRFLTEYPRHSLALHALYWRAEALYAQRHYARALDEFEAVLARSPNGPKTPDVLLKQALCYRHLGQERKAQAVLRRLRETFPTSQAATLASREGST